MREGRQDIRIWMASMLTGVRQTSAHQADSAPQAAGSATCNP
jgi:hypothetical protein